MSETNEQWADAEIDRLRADAVRRIEETDRVLVANGRLRAELAGKGGELKAANAWITEAREENGSLRAELALSKKHAEDMNDGWRTANFENHDLRAELAEAKARIAVLEGLVSQGISGEHAALIRAERAEAEHVAKDARIAELETYHTNCTDYINQLLDNMADDDKERVAILARAEQAEEQAHYANGVADLAMKHRDSAEARVAELEATILHWTSEVTRLEQNCDDDQDRAERAEDALKEQLQWKKSYTERAERAEARVAELDAQNQSMFNTIATERNNVVRAEAEVERLSWDITAKVHNLRCMDERFRRAEAERDAMREAAKKALHEMCNTVAPRTSFTDAVDELDAALAPSPVRRGGE